MLFVQCQKTAPVEQFLLARLAIDNLGGIYMSI